MNPGRRAPRLSSGQVARFRGDVRDQQSRFAHAPCTSCQYIGQMFTGTLDMNACCVEAEPPGAGVRRHGDVRDPASARRAGRSAESCSPTSYDVRSRTRENAESRLESEQLESEQLESEQLESIRPTAQLESLRTRVLGSLVGGPLSKAELSDRFGAEAGVRPAPRGGPAARGRPADRIHGAGQARQPTAEVSTDGDRQGHVGTSSRPGRWRCRRERRRRGGGS